MLKLFEVKGDVLEPSTYLSSVDFDSNVWVVQGCNAQGVMGSGLAKQVRERYPVAFNQYKEFFKNVVYPQDALGTYTFAKVENTDNGFTGSLRIVNAVTQENYGMDKNFRYTSYDSVSDVFRKLALRLSKSYATSGKDQVIAIPKKFASDRGNANWSIIKKIIKQELKDTQLTLYIVEFDK